MKVLIGTPCYGGKCFTGYVMSLIKTIELLSNNNIESKVEFLSCESLIPRGRNTIIAKFMGLQDYTHVLFIDADILWNPEDVLRLLKHDKDIIGGLYPLKNYNWDRIKNINDKNELSLLLNYNLNFKTGVNKIENGLIEIKHLATGFMLIKRNVIEKLKSLFPEKKYVDDIGCTSNDREKENLYAFFDCKIVNNHYLSEDWLFCDNWSKTGGKVFADLNINLSHIGNETYQGNTPLYINNLVKKYIQDNENHKSN